MESAPDQTDDETAQAYLILEQHLDTVFDEVYAKPVSGPLHYPLASQMNCCSFPSNSNCDATVLFPG